MRVVTKTTICLDKVDIQSAVRNHLKSCGIDDAPLDASLSVVNGDGKEPGVLIVEFQTEQTE